MDLNTRRTPSARIPVSFACVVFAGMGTFLAAGCQRAPREETPRPAPAPEGIGARDAAAPGAVPPAGSAEKPGAVPEALRDLEERIRPPHLVSELEKPTPTPAPEAPALPVPEEELLARAATAIGAFATAIGEGKLDAAKARLFSKDDLAAVVTPGFRDQIGLHIVFASEDLLETLFDRLKGKEIRHQWKPGKIVVVPEDAFFAKGTAVMGGGRLLLDAGGVAVEIQVEQMVLVGDSWKIFRFRIP